LQPASSIDWRSIFRSAAGIGGAAAFGHALMFFASPALSRLFTQDQFGRFSLFFGLANVLAIPATLGLQDAMLAADRPATVDALQQAAMRLLLVTLPVLGAVAWVIIACDWLGYGALPTWTAALIVLEVSALAFIGILQVRLVREREFRWLASSHLILGLARPVSQIGAGFLGTGFPGLALAELGSRLAVLGMLWRACGPAVRRCWRTIPLAECLRAARNYRAFLLYRTPSALCFNVGTALPPTLIAAAYGVTAAGLYSFMFTVIVAPVGLAQKAVGDVFLGHFIALRQSDARLAQRYFQRMTLALLAAAAVPAAALGAWGEDLFAFVFGEPWREAGHLARLIAPLFLCDLAIAPVTGVFNAVNRPQLKLAFDAARIGGILAVFFLSQHLDVSLDRMVQWLAWAGCLSYALYLVLLWKSVIPVQREKR
jgi:O-antigen/teichoic acid export membrane protein